MIGQTLSHYKIREEINRGSMGVVYRAVDVKLNRDVALKLLPADLVANPDRKRRFIQEAQAAAALDHPHVATVHEIDEVDGVTFIAMELIRGEMLRDAIYGGRLSPLRSLELATEIAEGLSRAHGKGIVHRDLKPTNIMVTEDGHAKIIDFGLAKLLDSLGNDYLETLTVERQETASGVILGTVSYMSPEQARGQPIDHRTDMFSLGTVLYEMLTGRLPFKAPSVPEVLSAIINTPTPPLDTTRAAGDSTDLQPLLDKSLAKDPDDRYQSMKELIVDLRAQRRRLESGMTAPAGRSRSSKSARHALVLMLGGLAVLAVVATLNTGTVRDFASSIFRRDVAVPFSERDWLLIADFENTTDEDIFDKSLNTAFTVGMGQSRYVNILPRRRVNDALRRMNKTDVERIGAVIAREIAVREGLGVLLVPSISGVGGNYVLSAVIEDVASGMFLSSEIVRVDGREKVIDALDELVQRTRAKLGETESSISKQNKRLVKVTTTSLDALKEYSVGIESHRQGSLELAKIHYEQALKIDPEFTAARASLGMCLFENFDRDEGRVLLAQAVEHVDDLTDRERYGILAFHARAVEGDLQKAIDYLDTLTSLYPDYPSAHNNRAWFLSQLGRYEAAVAEYEETIRLDPSLGMAYRGLGWIYLNELGEVGKAKTLCEDHIAHYGGNYFSYDCVGWAALGLGELDRAEAAFNKALELSPDFVLDIFRLGHTYRMQGRYDKAIETFLRVPPLAPDQAPSAYYDIGATYQLMGDRASGEKYLNLHLAETEKHLEDDPKDPAHYISVGLALSRLGETERGWAIGSKAIEIDPAHHFGMAELAAVQGRTQEALDQLAQAVDAGYRAVIWIKVNVNFTNLQGEPRFQELLAGKLKREPS